MSNNFDNANYFWVADTEIKELAEEDEQKVDLSSSSIEDFSFLLFADETNKLLNGNISLWSDDEEVEDVDEIQGKKINVSTANNTNIRCNIINRIEDTVLSMIKQICSGTLPTVSYPIPCHDVMTQMHDTQSQGIDDDDGESSNTFSEGSMGYFSDSQIFEGYSEKMVTVNFARRNSRDKLALLTTVLAKVHFLWLTESTMTRRYFYYELKDKSTARLAPSQNYVDRSVNNVASLLRCAPWDLRLLPSSKGLIAGDISIELMEGETIFCGVPGGALIPQMISKLVTFRSNANFALVVEKDTIFQMLLEENCTEKLNCVLITGKGYPDVATRKLIKLLSEQLMFPVYVVVDADPFGFDIMCVYRFGSLVLSKENDSLACPNVRWLGIHPSELDDISVPRSPLTEADLSKLTSIEARPYMTDAFLAEIRAMQKGKAEIEAVSGLSKHFLTSTYLPAKIHGRKYI